MFVYLLLIFYFVIGIIFKLDRKKNSIFFKLYFASGFLGLLFLSMFRGYSVGNDSEEYRIMFNVISNISFKDIFSVNLEVGFALMIKLLSLISNSPRILFIISSLIIITITGNFIYKYSEKPLFSSLLYILLNVYFFHLTGIRQSLAAVFLILAYENLLKEKKIKFVFWVFFASLFHNSAIIFLLVYFVHKLKYTKNTFLVIMLSSFVCFIAANQLFSMFSSLIGKYSGYSDSVYGDSNYFGTLIQFFLVFIIYIICNFIIVKTKNKNEIFINNKSYFLLLKLVSLAVVLRLMAVKMKIIGRMSPYFSLYVIVCLPNSLSLIKNPKNREFIEVCMAAILMLYWLIVCIFRPEWNGVIPYEFLFDF